MSWKSTFLKITSDAEQLFDELKVRLLRRLYKHPITIMTYLGYGTDEKFYFRGRVLEDKGIPSAKETDTIWQNLVSMYRRYNSDEIPHAQVRASYGEYVTEVTADEEGFFILEIAHNPNLPRGKVFFDLQLELIDYPQRAHELQDIHCVGQVMVPPKTAQFGIISDLDDTVLRTDVLNILKMARNTFLRNSRTRLPFEGVAAFYTALQAGTAPEIYNPIFYVSSSPWNLYDLIVDFFEVRGIPSGPLFLKDMGLDDRQFIDGGHRAHKVKIIQQLLDTYPDLPFLLIGDSGQRDPEIYTEIARNNPGRILAIYIRDVTQGERRDRSILQLADTLKPLGVELLLVPDTVRAAEDAVLKGLIPEEALIGIRIERTEDKKEPEKLEKLLDPEASVDELYDEEAAATNPKPKPGPVEEA